ncbi:ABC transporter permease [Streptomyces sp. HB132]|uniref:ABC transporter permease n=1 Tax=Streptomyces sp. HB132 TaxID=767388 RepID=UPI0019619C2A|nr:ABC transporter permease [Streptomyces sp. HB132]MBM7442333.1 hypothetical protein [Streptomyces sp. HB132]
MPAAPNRRAVAVILLVPLIVTISLWAFSWPAARIAPRDLPVGIAGAAPAADQMRKQLEQRGGAFEIHRYDDTASAREAIEDRAVYGAFVVTEKGPQLLTASAASPVAAQLLTEAAKGAAPTGTALPVTDVVAAPGPDPRGAALGASILPLSLAGVAAGAMVTVMKLRGTRAVLTLVGASGLVGVVATAVAHSWLGVVTGDWLTEAGVIGLTVLAMASAVGGLAALLGTRGIGVGALLMVLLGNSFSGVTSAPEMLPEPVGAIGQLLPPGAGGSLLRSVAFFDGAAVGTAAPALAAWAALGLVAVVIGGRRKPDAADTTEAPGHHREPALTG